MALLLQGPNMFTVTSHACIEGLWDILLSFYYKFTANFIGERISKIGQHLAEVAATI